MSGICIDITDRKLSEEALFNAQKLESIGTLAGGIAHDFNNLMNSVLGQSALALHKLPKENPAVSNIQKAIKSSERVGQLYDLLQANDLQGLKDLFHAFYATIPYQWYSNSTVAQYEGYYASIFYSYFAALGLEIVLEDTTNHGRIDMTVKFEGRIYIFEFKVVEAAATGDALAQIKAKQYAAKYAGQGLAIYLIGVEFSKASKNVVGFEVEPFGEAP